ncbi:MAG: YezD family protein [Candidatus Omnitrophica bacterium]|nr:YezD family protein [Candidatus Omnitrophota bacterium]
METKNIMVSNPDKALEKKSDPSRIILEDILKAIKEIDHGSVQIHIQDGKIIQIDKISKLRMR